MSPRARRGKSDWSTQRILADGVVAMTLSLVGQARKGHWDEVTQTLHARRSLLAELELATPSSSHGVSCVAALRSAVIESEGVVVLLRRPERACR